MTKEYTKQKQYVAIVGCGYVADFYLRSKDLHPNIEVVGAFDIRSDRLHQFCNYWNLKPFKSLENLLANLPENGIVLNLTNPTSHYQVTRTCLEAGRHVYSEKPLATEIGEALELADLSRSNGVLLSGAPCSYLSETALTLGEAINRDVCGKVRLIYAELDDGFIPQAPYQSWISESGATWPYEDEMRTGCTLEHAGYVLTWMIAIFGTIKSITAFSEKTVDKGLDPECDTPDTCIGVLKFESGPILRLTITIVAPHNHHVLITGDKGTLELGESWDNHAKVLFRKRFRIRRRLLEAPIPKRLRFGKKQAGAPAKRRGSPAMDYLLGPAEMLRHLNQGGSCLAPADLALHTTEATLALQLSGTNSMTYQMRTRCDPLPLFE